MAMGTRQSEQGSLWVATAELPKSPGHPFYTRLNALLDADDFDRFVEGQCARFYAPVMGRPSLAPGRYKHGKPPMTHLQATSNYPDMAAVVPQNLIRAQETRKLAGTARFVADWFEASAFHEERRRFSASRNHWRCRNC
jgi:hypothetical protein